MCFLLRPRVLEVSVRLVPKKILVVMMMSRRSYQCQLCLEHRTIRGSVTYPVELLDDSAHFTLGFTSIISLGVLTRQLWAPKLRTNELTSNMLIPLSKQVFIRSLTISPFWVPPTLFCQFRMIDASAGRNSRQPSTITENRDTLIISKITSQASK